MNKLVTILLLTTVSTPLLATEWVSEEIRGVETFTVKSENDIITVVCDPDRVHDDPTTEYVTDNTGITVTSGSLPDTGLVFVLFPDGSKFPLNLIDQTALRTDNQDGINDILAGLQNNNQFAILDGNYAAQYKVDEYPVFNCDIPEKTSLETENNN